MAFVVFLHLKNGWSGLLSACGGHGFYAIAHPLQKIKIKRLLAIMAFVVFFHRCRKGLPCGPKSKFIIKSK
jgi:hypothetical protein